MRRIQLSETDGRFAELGEVLSFSDAADFLLSNDWAIALFLDHAKATDWPWKGWRLSVEPTDRIPLLWATVAAVDKHHLGISYDIHPAKCFPNLYNEFNPHRRTSPMPIITSSGATLAGCSRNFVTMSSRRYDVAEKTPQYCSIFGLPDDCYDPGFEQRMTESLRNHGKARLWCFERTDYIERHIERQLGLHYMKGEFLPSRHFIHTDTAQNFLRGVFTTRQIEALGKELWYSSGRELIDDMDLNDAGQCFRFEEQADFYVAKRVVYESARLLLLLMNRKSFSLFVSKGPPTLNLAREKEFQADLAAVCENAAKEASRQIEATVSKTARQIDMERLKKSRFTVLDAEYIHVSYPTGQRGRTFNFPCVFAYLTWQGSRKGFQADVSVMTLPCHFCEVPCRHFNNGSMAFDCISYAVGFVEKQVSFLEEKLSLSEGFKVYSYGRSDVFAFEQADAFFADSFVKRTFERRNRKRAQRLVDISEDLSVPGKSLREIEDSDLRNCLTGWSREGEKVEVNRRFMTRYVSPRWKDAYSTAVQSCGSDAVSALMYLMCTRYSLGHAGG